jgi:hypothetical protein
MGDLAELLGALIPAFLISRLFIWLTKRWSGIVRLAFVHLASAALACVLSALGHAHNGQLDWTYSHVYIGAQFVWFVAEIFRGRRKLGSIADEWYYTNLGKQLGPFSFTEMATELRKLPNWRDANVWRSGLGNWVPAGSVPELTRLPSPLPKGRSRWLLPEPANGKWSLRSKLVGAATFFFVLVAVAVGNSIGREGVHYVMKPSQQERDQASIDGLLKAEQELKPTLPKKLNDWTTMTEVRVQGKTLIYTYQLDDANYVIPEGHVNAVMQKEVTKSVCASEMIKAIRDGVSFRYTYQDTKRTSLGSFEVGLAECSR